MDAKFSRQADTRLEYHVGFLFDCRPLFFLKFFFSSFGSV